MRWILSLGVAVAGLAAWAVRAWRWRHHRQARRPDSAASRRSEVKLDLPTIPAKIEVTTSAPTDGNAPDKRSPILDILKAENEREMAALEQDSRSPAYYLGYQLVEQRIVNLEAEGGALVTDSDDTARNLDVEVRVGSPELDNTRQLADDTNGLNAPLTRRGVVPFGEDKQALSNALWLETDRRYREAVTALGYVRQDQPTLSRSTRPAPDFSAEPRRDLRRGARQARVRQGAVGRAPQALLGEGAQGRRRRAARAASCSSSTPRTSSTARAARSSSRGPTRSSRSRSASRPTTA